MILANQKKKNILGTLEFQVLIEKNEHNCICCICIHQDLTFATTKETTLERVDFTLQLLLFLTGEEERRMFIISLFPVFVSCCARAFKQG